MNEHCAFLVSLSRLFQPDAFRVKLCRMAFRIDPHVHSFYSGDGVSSPEALVQSGKRAGLDGFVLTDHNTCDGCRYLRDVGLLREDGEAVDGFLVIPGVEVSTLEGHLLCLGVWLPNGLKGAPAKQVMEMVREQNGVAIPAHPYDRLRAGIREDVLDDLDLQCLEVFNAATVLQRHNASALNYAKKRTLAMTAGSDAHHHAAIGRSHTLFPAERLSMRAVLDSITRGTELHCEPLSAMEGFRKTFYNWFRLRKTRCYRGAGTEGSGAATGGA
jgi:predicted metal-dependent phosphoesterase TrpH